PAGGPKGVLRPHRCYGLMSLAMAVEYGCFTAEDRQLAVSPFFHGMGSGWAIASILNGGYCAIAQIFQPELALELVATQRITSTIVAPTHVKSLLALGDETVRRYVPTSLPAPACGGSPTSK